ncbi:enoyl-CoA hydratase/isomerase family protein [Acuticoccus sp. MNP-M23]|uniref:enoyl-CoA hydratase/isomerase family protein n=1 Tax=Acuticoccus sp. MNP-M23 TaxID=3072793 RepID=UPI002814F7CA|nr:enoyl-CoA hydratase/isomerase family protein [Acuticoccus sp. MNP-M23]WMS41371.1 enoyl-CoA hydratase/isomerase family protein [Acuticoccus sp. MNP-M23]
MTGSLEITDRGPVRQLAMTGVPSRGNPLSVALIAALHSAVLAAEADPAIRVMVLTGTERFFSVGADLRDVDKLTATDAVLANWLNEFDRIARCAKPIVAAVRGHAVGGGFELALTCDMIVAAEDAAMSLPETGIGVIPGQGGTQRILQLAGRAIAADLVLTGRILSGVEARELGIVARTAPAADVLATAHEVADAIAARSEPAVRFAREILREASEGHLQQTLRMERLFASLILDTDERRQRVGDFLKKRGR